MTRRKQHCPKRMKWEGGEGEEPPAGYQEDDGGCPEDDEDDEEEEEEGVSGGSSGSPPRSPIPSSTDVEQDANTNERLPQRETNSPSKMSRGSPARSESSLPPYEVPLLATVSPGRSPPATSDVLDFSTKRPASPVSSLGAMNLSSGGGGGSNNDSPIDLTIRSKKIKLEPSPVSSPPSVNDIYARMSRPWAQYTTPVIRPISRGGEMMTPPSEPSVHHLWNGGGKHGKIPPYGSPSSFANATSDATKALEKMCELTKLQDEPTRSVLAPSSGRHSAWQSHWLNKGADQTKDVLKCVWCKMSFPTLQAMSAHMAETKHGTAATQSLQPPPPPPPPAAASASSASSGHKNDLNMLIKETMPLPRKLVRGQDVWLGKGAEQTRQILKCMWCGQSFRSLQEMTTHMQQTQHYTNIISQEQIISWKSADENKSSGGTSGGGSSNAASTSSPVGSGTANTASSANHVSAVLTCKVCDQAFNSLKELSVHMVKNSHYKEHMMRSITEGSNRRRQTREKRKKSLPVRKLLELERAQHEVKNGDGSGGYATGFKTAGNDAAANHHHHQHQHHHRLGRIICEKCGEKVDVAGFMEHLRVCVTMTADQKNLLKTALMSQNTLSADHHQSGGGRGEKRSKKDQQQDRCQDLSVNKSASAGAITTAGSSSSSSTSSPSVLNAIEKLIEKSFDSRLRYGVSAAGASIGESILKRLGIDESVDATKPIMDMQAMNLLRSYQSLGRHERSGSESSSMSPELAAMRSDSTTPDRKYESAADYQRMRSVTPKSTPERHHSPKSSSGSSSTGGGNKNSGPPSETAACVEAKGGGEGVAAGDGTAEETTGGAEFEVKKEYVADDDDASCKSPLEEQQRARSRESANNDETNGSSRGATPTNVIVKSSPSSPAGSDKSAATDGGKKTPVATTTTSSLGALSSMFESLTSATANGGGGSSATNGENGGAGGKSGGGGGAASSHPLAALQKLCDKTENHHHPHHHHRPSSRSSSNASATNGGGPAQSMSPPAASVTGATAPGAILAFSWACNDAVVTADSIMKCAFCDTPFISKGAYRHHLSKVHFVKEGITPEPIMLKSASAVAAAAAAAAAAAGGHQPSPSSSTSVTAHSPSPSPSSSSQNKSSPNHNNNNNNSSNNNNNNNNNGSPSTSSAGGGGGGGGGACKSPESKNGGYDESPHSKFLKYTELAKQLSSKYV